MLRPSSNDIKLPVLPALPRPTQVEREGFNEQQNDWITGRTITTMLVSSPTPVRLSGLRRNRSVSSSTTLLGIHLQVLRFPIVASHTNRIASTMHHCYSQGRRDKFRGWGCHISWAMRKFKLRRNRRCRDRTGIANGLGIKTWVEPILRRKVVMERGQTVYIARYIMYKSAAPTSSDLLHHSGFFQDTLIAVGVESSSLRSSEQP